MIFSQKPDSIINVKAEFGKGKVPFEPKYKPEVQVTCKMIKEYKVVKYGFNYILHIL